MSRYTLRELVSGDVSREDVNRYIGWSRRAINAMNTIITKLPNNTDNLFGKAVKTLSIADVVYGLFKNDTDFESNLAKQYGMVKIESPFIISLFKSGAILQNSRKEIFKISDHCVLYLLHGEKCKYLFTQDRNDFGCTLYVSNPNGIFECFSDLWITYNNRMYVEVKTDTYRDAELNFSMVCNEVGNINPTGQLLVKKYKDKPSPCTLLLFGIPGSGKSSLPLSLVGNGKLLKLDHRVISRVSVGDMIFFLTNVKPDIVVIDDFDRLYSMDGTAKFLYVLEAIRKINCKLVLTANHLDKLDRALLRAGRIDYVEKIMECSEDDRKWFLTGLNLSIDNIDFLIGKTTDYTCADMVSLVEKLNNYSPQEAVDFMELIRSISKS